MSAYVGAPLGLPPRGAPPGAKDALSLIVGNRSWEGWQRVSVARTMEGIPATFDIQVTEKYPTGLSIAIAAGDPCQVKIGGDLVITGYVDQYASAISPNDHTVRITGRSKSQDLVDCSAFMGSRDKPAFQYRGSAVAIARELARQYDVTVGSIAGDGVVIPQQNINLGETPWELIDRIAKVSKFVVYDMPDGSVRFAQAGREEMASGFEMPGNVEAAAVTYSMNDRFSQYEAHLLSTMVYANEFGVNATPVGGLVEDQGVSRFRKRYIISEQMMLGQPIVHDRAVWERNRRFGHSQQINIRCDAWRDAQGQLWAPNHLAPLRIPQLKAADATWLIASVNYTRDETGQHAQLVMMPVEAFSPEPIVITNQQLTVQAVEAANAARKEGDKTWE